MTHPSSADAERPLSAAPVDLAGVGHWDAVWERPAPRPLPTWSYYTVRLDAMFRRHVRAGDRLIEIGAGDSRWLPYLAQRLGCDVWGLDYSAIGVETARARLAAAGVPGDDRILFGDVFAPQPALEGRFDVLWSHGFIEHFDDVAKSVRRMAEYLRPGGTMITVVPNMDGAIGALHRLVDPDVFAMHQHLDPAGLDRCHQDAGLTPVEPGHYLGVFSLGVVNCDKWLRRLPRVVARVGWGAVLATQQGVCLPFRVLGVHPESRALSPYVVGVYRRDA